MALTWFGLNHLKNLSTSVSRQLFIFTVCTAVDYASILWSHQISGHLRPAPDKIQQLRTKFTTRVLKSEALSMLESAAGIAH